MKLLKALCKIGLHVEYNYLPKVSGFLGKEAVACRICGYGKNWWTGKWDILPEEVQEDEERQVAIQYGQILGWLRGGDAGENMEFALEKLKKDSFTQEEIDKYCIKPTSS